jgi:hypothetical protein
MQTLETMTYYIYTLHTRKFTGLSVEADNENEAIDVAYKKHGVNCYEDYMLYDHKPVAASPDQIDIMFKH